MDELVRFQCPACGRRLKIPREKAGKRARCLCGQGVVIPSSVSLSLDDVAPTSPRDRERPTPAPMLLPLIDKQVRTPTPRRLWLWLAGAGGVFVIAILGIWLVAGPKYRPVAVIGIGGQYLYSDKECKTRMSETPLAIGAVFSVQSLQDDDIIEVVDRAGSRGWLYRGVLCTPSELQRRTAQQETPANVLLLKEGSNGEVIMYMGEVFIDAGGPVLRPGDTIWMNSTMNSRKYIIATYEIVGDSDFLFLVSEDKSLAKLPVWKWGQ